MLFTLILICVAFATFFLLVVNCTNTTFELEENIRSCHACMQNVLQNRQKLMTKLNDIVAAYLDHESAAITSLKDIHTIFAKYPSLVSSNIITRLLNQINDAETQILLFKNQYVEHVKKYKLYIRNFPTCMLSWATKYDFKYI